MCIRDSLYQSGHLRRIWQRGLGRSLSVSRYLDVPPQSFPVAHRWDHHSVGSLVDDYSFVEHEDDAQFIVLGWVSARGGNVGGRGCRYCGKRCV